MALEVKDCRYPNCELTPTFCYTKERTSYVIDCPCQRRLPLTQAELDHANTIQIDETLLADVSEPPSVVVKQHPNAFAKSLLSTIKPFGRKRKQK